MTRDRFVGCLLGLALGDALGARLEGGPLERMVWRVIGRTRRGEMRWTDDTQMALDVAESLVAQGKLDPDDLAVRFARNYRWSRGYGPGSAKLLKRIRRGADWRQASRSVWPKGSFGNGAAMRAPVVGLFFADHVERLDEAAEISAAVTHAHPLAIAGAVLVARATASALRVASAREILREAGARSDCVEYQRRLLTADDWLERRQDVSPAEVAQELGNGTAAIDSCVTALYLAGRFLDEDFLAMHGFIVRCGGDVDTIGAMAGAIWGAVNGAEKLPSEMLTILEQHERIRALGGKLFEVRRRAEWAP